MFAKLRLLWFGITHVVEITDYLAQRIDHVEGLLVK